MWDKKPTHRQKQAIARLVIEDIDQEETSQLIMAFHREQKAINQTLVNAILTANQTNDDVRLAKALRDLKSETPRGQWQKTVERLGIHRKKAQRLVNRPCKR